MKTVLAVGLIVATVCVLVAQRSQMPQQDADAIRILERIEYAVAESLLKGPSANQQHLADDVVLTMPDGRIVTKKQAVDDVRTKTLALDKCRLSDLKVRVYGDTAIVTYRTADSGMYNGRRFEGQTQWTDVFLRRGGAWQVVAGHGSTIPTRR